MPKLKVSKNAEREKRIINEIVVDAYDEGERAMGWYCHAENEMTFPFRARCLKADELSPLHKGEEVEVVGLPSSDSCLHGLRVRIRWLGRQFATHLEQLDPIDATDKTREVIKDWRYWKQMGYEF